MIYGTPFGDSLFSIIAALMCQMSHERIFPLSALDDSSQVPIKLERQYHIQCSMEKNSLTDERTPEQLKTFKARANRWLVHQLQLNNVYGVYIDCGMLYGIPVLLVSDIKDMGSYWLITVIWGDAGNWQQYVNCVRAKLNLK